MKRTKINLSHYRLFTTDMGKMTPCGLVEVLPGDTFQHTAAAMVRVTPMIAPLMHPIQVRIHHFFVPNRLVWPEPNGWETFITGGPDNDDTSTIPTIAADASQGNLYDYLGVPPLGVDDQMNQLPIRGANLIWNEFYRDQDLGTERLEMQTGLPKIAWEKDYFTTARPWPQKGPDILLPAVPAVPTPEEQISINELRELFAQQRYSEARAKYGSRYIEYLRYLGVKSSDGRLDRPEYLGGGSVPLSISEVLQTAPEGATPPTSDYGVGDMFGHGIAAMRTNGYRRYFEEHGYVFSMFSVRPKAMYTNGINRTWLRQDREDYFQKELEQIGAEEIKVGEVYSAATDLHATFGYQDRYASYRGMNSEVAGEFRTTLDYWHMARKFASEPALNESFIECTPTKRVYAEQTQNDLWVMVQHQLAARRIVSRSTNPRVL